MKKTNYIATLSRAFMALAVMGAMTSCTDDAGLLDIFHRGNGDGLTVMPVVSEPTVVTRTASDATLKEEELVTLDVFVESQDNLGTIMKQYHRTSTDNIDEIGHQVQSLLADNWRAEGLEVGKKYNVYVAVNNPLTTATTLTTVAELKALTYNEVTDHVAIVNEANNNVTWGETTTSGNIYKLYDANPGSARALTNDKKFMMDGILKDWQPDATTRDQVFQPVTLNRAAAKIVLNVKFDEDFVKSLKQTKKVEGETVTWVDKPEDQQVTITGSPAWKFYNFAFGAPVFAPETDITAGEEVHNSDFNIFHNQSCADGASFQIVTYTYPNAWAATDYATKAPSLVISIPYTENGVTNYGYYRIPLVKSTVTEIERNHIYVINATIATRGSEIQEDQDEIENLYYEVLPWNDQTNSVAIKNDVEPIQNYYFNVNPKVYTLRGDGDQSVILNYTKATGTKVNWKLFTYDANGNQTGVVANDDEDAVRAWFYNSSGDFTTTYDDDSGTDWSQMGVSIVQSTEGRDGSNGTVTVTSTALNNKGIKYIRLRVYLDEEETFQDGKETMYEDIIIRHFPTDNIQNIAGSWSSYHDANNTTEMITMTTRSLSTAQSWAAEYGVEYSIQENLTATDYITYSQYSAHAGEEGYAVVNAQATTNRNTFRTYVQSETQRQAANGQSNGVLGEDGYCYWGVNPSASWQYQNDYDYRIDNGGQGPNRYSYYRYATIYRARYSHTYTYTQYSVTVPGASTGDWVDWDDRTSHSPARTYTINYGTYDPWYGYQGTFDAKVMQNGTMYAITESGGYGSYTTTTGSAESLTNNHMYVIQISSTSDSYVLGRPYVNTTTHQSQDNVVSPAFMIASQLGAVLPFTGDDGPANAATHCSRYMEVAEDGTRYTGWRLPTEAEISVITDYQYGTIGGVAIPSAYQTIVPVLTGMYYHSLSGQEVMANPNAGTQSQTKSYLRCVRDLSAEEVERLNNFEAIQEKYR